MTLAVIAGAALVAASARDEPGSSRDSVKETGVVGPRQSPAASTPDETGSELDEREALALFGRLRRRLEGAYRRRSVGSLLEAVGRDSPQYLQSRRDLQLLEGSNLLDRTRSRTLKVSVVAIDPGRVVVSERTVVSPRFVDDATYVEVDLQLERTRSSSEWTLERQNDRWVITSSRATG